MTGQTIAHYEITDKLGEGGMGVVYRARDTKLGREAALKVLPPAFAGDSQRMARFEREARVLASLNHPNIAAIHGLEESNGVRALAMELVEGPTLADRIMQGPLRLDEALPIARQIADALEYAHENGVIHRDLKPANVKLKPNGTVKVLDFGLAKAMEDDPSAADPANSPTLTVEATKAGVILGTAAYMAPEQARGKPVDKRADIWAFGVVLCEMLGGRSLFGGETVSDSLAKVLQAPLDFSALPAGTPASIRTLLRRCLERDPKRRLRDIGEARVAIEEVLEGKAEPAGAVAAPTMPRRRLLALGATAFFAAGAGAGFLLRRSPPASKPPRRVFALATDVRVTHAVISPNGKHVAFRGVAPLVSGVGGASLWIWDLDQEAPRRLGTIANAAPFWSPNSAFVGFRDGNEIKKVPVAGGAASTICSWDQPNFPGAAWSPDGETIVFSSRAGQPTLYEVAAAGGTPKPLRDDDEYSYRFPAFLPAQAAAPLLVARTKAQGTPEIVVRHAGKDADSVVVPGGRPVYSPSGHILYESQGGIWAIPFSVTTGKATGEAFPVRQLAAWPSVSADGALVYISAPGTGTRQLLWKSRSGERLGVIGQPQDGMGSPCLSPDEKRVAVSGTENGNRDIWIHDVERGLKTRFTFGEGSEDRPIWSPDGKQIVFASPPAGGNMDGYIKPADGSGEPVALVTSDKLVYIEDWSRDGRYMVATVLTPASGDIAYLKKNDRDGTYELVPVVSTPFVEGDAALSPDAKWIAYRSNESGRNEVYVQRFPEGGGRVQVSANGGSQPWWRRDGKELFYVAGETITAVPVNQGTELSFGKPVALFQQPGLAVAGRHYDVSADGQKFVVIESVGEAAPAVIRVVEDWFSEFSQRR